MNLQQYSDTFLARTFLPFIPRSVTPNMVSWARIASLPFIYYLLVVENYALGFVLFALAALTDALDGAMARVRDQETELGKVLDAVADRGLIGLVALIFIPKYFGWPLLIALGVLEGVNGVAAYRSRTKIGFNPGANWAGKVKMIIQCIAFLFLFASFAMDKELFLSIAYYMLLASLVFTIIQTRAYPSRTEDANRLS